MGPDRHAQTRLKHGTQIWLTGHLRGTSKIYNQEISTYESMITHAEKEMKGPKIDLLEIFAGKANLTFRAPRHGLSALEPIDREINLDLYKPEDRRFLWQVVDKFKPLLIAIAWPCKFWSLFNENMNYSHRPDELEDLREQDRPLVQLGTDLMHHQHNQGRLFLGENPLRSRIWREDNVEEVAQLPGVLTPKCDAGAYGAESLDGFPIVKTHKWITNSVKIAEELQRKMTDGESG